MAEPTIHHQRRWYYALWTALLALSCLALLVWETPARTELASLDLRIKISGAPAGTRLQAWAGPWARWPGPAWSGEGAFADLELPPGGAATLPLLRVHIARRRFGLGYISRGTWDLVMVKVSAPGQAPRFLVLPCSQDIRTGLLRSRIRVTAEISSSWNNLRVDGNPPNRVP